MSGRKRLTLIRSTIFDTKVKTSHKKQYNNTWTTNYKESSYQMVTQCPNCKQGKTCQCGSQCQCGPDCACPDCAVHNKNRMQLHQCSSCGCNCESCSCDNCNCNNCHHCNKCNQNTILCSCNDCNCVRWFVCNRSKYAIKQNTSSSPTNTKTLSFKEAQQ